MKSNKIFSIALSVFVSFVFVFAVTFAATTISTNISTGGTLTVSDNSVLASSDIGGGYTAGSGSGATISATGAISANGDLAINGFATTTASNGNFATKGTLTSAGAVAASSTLQVTLGTTLYSTLDVSGKTTLGNASTTVLTVSGNTYLATTTLTSGGLLTLGTLASDPSATTNGQMYYSTGVAAIRVYQGGSWANLGAANGWTHGSAVTYPTAMADQFLIGTTTVSGLSQLTVEATSTAGIPLTLRGFTGQTADLFRLHNSSGTELFALDASGNAYTTMISTTGNMWVGGFATTTGSNGNFATLGTLVGSSTLQVTGATTLYSTLNVTGVTTLANASTSQITTTGNVWVNGFATTTASNGNFATLGSVAIASTSPSFYVALGVTGTTTSSLGMVVGSAGSPINNLLFGTCTVDPNDGPLAEGAATTTTCTATGVLAGDKVFITPANLLAGLYMVSASSTAGAIQVSIGSVSSTSPTITSYGSWSWMSVR